jgi:hypothetical protein
MIARVCCVQFARCAMRSLATAGRRLLKSTPCWRRSARSTFVELLPAGFETRARFILSLTRIVRPASAGILIGGTPSLEKSVRQVSWTHDLMEPQGGSEEDSPGWGCSRSQLPAPSASPASWWRSARPLVRSRRSQGLKLTLFFRTMEVTRALPSCGPRTCSLPFGVPC